MKSFASGKVQHEVITFCKTDFFLTFGCLINLNILYDLNFFYNALALFNNDNTIHSAEYKFVLVGIPKENMLQKIIYRIYPSRSGNSIPYN
jgi:hypothetical protein